MPPTCRSGVLTRGLAGTQWSPASRQELRGRCSDAVWDTCALSSGDRVANASYCRPQTRKPAVTGVPTSQRESGLSLKLCLGELCRVFKAADSKIALPCTQELR